MGDNLLKIIINGKLADISELKVAELKIELKKRGLSTTGTKKNLYEKLKSYLLESNSSQENQIESNNVLNISNDLVANNSKENLNTTTENESKIEIDESELSINQSGTLDLTCEDKIETLKENLELKKQVGDVIDESKCKIDEIAAAIVSEVVVEEISNKNVNETQEAINEVAKTQISNECVMDVQISADIQSTEVVVEAETKELLAETQTDHKKTTDVVIQAETQQSNDETVSISNESESTMSKSEESVEINQVKIDEKVEINENTDVEEPAKENEAKIEDAAKLEEKCKEQTVESIEAPKIQKKRKWFNNDVLKPTPGVESYTISTDSLKTYLPETKLLKLKQTEIDANILQASTIVEPTAQIDENSSKSEEQIVFNEHKTLSTSNSRTVIIEENNELIYEDALNTSDAPKVFSDSVHHPNQSENDLNKSNKSVTTNINNSDKSSTNILHIKCLTRPFTVNQLKDTLKKYGNLIESSFWIDSVKSHCYLAFETAEEAQNARNALNGQRWPQSNPKTLIIEYSTEDELKQHSSITSNQTTTERPHVETDSINGGSSRANAMRNLVQDTLRSSLINDKENKEKIKVKKSDLSDNQVMSNKILEKPIREWDIPKLRRSRSRSRDRSEKEVTNNHHNGKESTDSTAALKSPVKLLDDLFKKTTTTPFIYWLPLTDEQVLEKQAKIEKYNSENVQNVENKSSHHHRNNLEKSSENPEIKKKIIEENEPLKRKSTSKDRIANGENNKKSKSNHHSHNNNTSSSSNRDSKLIETNSHTS